MNIGDKVTKYQSTNSNTELVDGEIPHVIVIDKLNFIIPNLKFYMFRRYIDQGLSQFVEGSDFDLCEDPTNKLVALRLRSNPSKIIKMSTLFDSLIQKIN